jgi:hypothetical protein
MDGIGWRCHRRQGLLSSRTSFRRGCGIVFYDMGWHSKNLERPCSTWSPFWKWNVRNKFLVPCRKDSVYHPFHSKLHSDYLKSQLQNLKNSNGSRQPSRRAISGYNFVRVV